MADATHPHHRGDDDPHAMTDKAPTRIAPGRAPATGRLGSVVLRKAALEAPGGVAAGAEQTVDRAASSRGDGLPDDVRAQFEQSLGVDLSAVRLHTGPDSATAAAAVGARAYAMGDDIHFAEGAYAPTDPFGLHLLAHEVAHTQQQAGGSPHRQHKLAMSSPGDVAELEADRAADAMVAGREASVSGTASGAIHRRIEPPAPNGSQSHIAYPPSLLAACPSLQMAGPVETTASGGAALQALADSACTTDDAKQRFDAQWAKVAGVNIGSLEPGEFHAIRAATAEPGTGNAARTSTEAVVGLVDQLSNEHRDLDGAIGDCQHDNVQIVAYQHLVKAALDDQNAAEKSKAAADVGVMATVSTLLGQLTTGVVGEAAKLLTMLGVEKNPAIQNPSNGPLPPFQGTALASLLEDGAGGAVAMIPVFLDWVTGASSKRAKLMAEVSMLQDAGRRERWTADSLLLGDAIRQLAVDGERLRLLREAILRDTTQLKVHMADMNHDLDAKTGQNTFGKIAGDEKVLRDVIDAAQPYAIACQDLQGKAGWASSAVYAAGSNPSDTGLPPSDDGTSPSYDPSQLSGELRAFAAKQIHEILDAEQRKEHAQALVQMLQSRQNQAFAEASAGLQDSSSPVAPGGG